MKLMRTEDAVGQMLCHDITQIIRGVSKGPVFKKGHIITEEDIPVLLSVGKDTIYIWEVNENMMHENDAARVLCELSINEHMHASDISEGKIELIADCPGLLKVDKKRLNAINSLGEMMIASRHGNFAVKAGDKIAGMRVIPPPSPMWAPAPLWRASPSRWSPGFWIIPEICTAGRSPWNSTISSVRRRNFPAWRN